jgi:hypothetical protein
MYFLYVWLNDVSKKTGTKISCCPKITQFHNVLHLSHWLSDRTVHINPLTKLLKIVWTTQFWSNGRYLLQRPAVTAGNPFPKNCEHISIFSGSLCIVLSNHTTALLLKCLQIEWDAFFQALCHIKWQNMIV